MWESPIWPIALGIRAVEEKMRVRFWTAADLVQDLYSHLADGASGAHTVLDQVRPPGH